jgi:hypothetical protein
MIFLFDDILQLNHMRESMTGVVMTLCKLIKWPDPKKIINLVGKVHTLEAAKDAAKDLTTNNPENYQKVYDIIVEETVEADEAERRYMKLLEK